MGSYAVSRIDWVVHHGLPGMHHGLGTLRNSGRNLVPADTPSTKRSEEATDEMRYVDARCRSADPW